MKPTDSTCIVVLGGHRCGTSAVAGVLAKLGVFMGDKMIGKNASNPRGHWEDVEFVNLNRQIVGHWKAPVVDFAPHRAAYVKLVRAREGTHKLWGFKDPRMCFIFPHFLGIVRAKVKVVNVERNLVASAKSMMRRRSKKGTNVKVSETQARRLSRAYRDARAVSLALFNGPVLTVRYEDLIADPPGVVAQIADFVGLPVTDAAVKHIDKRLKHF